MTMNQVLESQKNIKETVLQEKEFLILEKLSLIYEDMDIDAVEERFVNLVDDLFSFDRVGLFFVKHRKNILQGKLSKGFLTGAISSLQIPIEEQYLFIRPLFTGLPLWTENLEHDKYVQQLDLSHFSLIPIINTKRLHCWKIKNCTFKYCPAYKRKWLRCWMVSNTLCCDGAKNDSEAEGEFCESCPIFSHYKTANIEGVLLVDNSISKIKIDLKTITTLCLVAHAVGIAINNTKAYSHAIKNAIHDDLTGLHNRRYFNDRLLDEVDRARRYGKQISLLMCDIDNFKRINDTFGHQIGDTVLKNVGRVLRNRLRQSDVVARYGGEEFAIILINDKDAQVVEIAEGLRRLVGDTIGAVFREEEIKVTISIGIATGSSSPLTVDSLIRKADNALYCAKAQGRNRVCLS